jgi:hypothetical protein
MDELLPEEMPVCNHFCVNVGFATKYAGFCAFGRPAAVRSRTYPTIKKSEQ